MLRKDQINIGLDVILESHLHFRFSSTFGNLRNDHVLENALSSSDIFLGTRVNSQRVINAQQKR
jgi:hypothetical protein